ncbi:MAG: hypothetical protein BGO10_01965 [Chlamydia sp. 32-24]|nr:MAG: hypothetical protein BGO10_01965 [Chlamydia sp. 32-24]
MNNIDNLVGQNPQNLGNEQPIHPQKRKAQQLSDVEIKNFKETNDPTQPKSLHFRKVGVFTPPSLERESYNESLQEFRGFTRQLVEELYENKINPIIKGIHNHIGFINGIWTSITNTFKDKFGIDKDKLYAAFYAKPEGDTAIFVSQLKDLKVDIQSLTQDEQLIYEWLNNNHFKNKSLETFYEEKKQSSEGKGYFLEKWAEFARKKADIRFKDNLKLIDEYLKKEPNKEKNELSNFETLIKENLFRIVDSLSGRITHLIKGLSDSGEYKKVFDQLLLRISKQIEAENKASETVTEYNILYKKAVKNIDKADAKRAAGKALSVKEQKDLTYWQDFKKKVDDFGGIDAFKDQIRLDFAKRALEEEQKDEYSELVEDLFSIVFQDKDILNVIKQFSFLPEPLKHAVDELKIITNLSTKDTHLQKIHSALSLIETGCNLGLSYLEKFLVNQAINKVSEPSFLGDIWENSILPNVRNALIKSNLQECITKDLKDFSEEFSKYLQHSNQAQEFMTYCVSPLECFALLGSLNTITPAIFAQIKAKELNEATKDLVSHLKFQYSQFKSFKDFELFAEKLVQKIQSFATYPEFANFLTQNNQAQLKFNDIVELLVREKPSTLYFDYDKDISQKELNHLVIEYVSELTKVCHQVNPNDYSQNTVVLILKEQFKAKNHGERSPAISHLVKQIAVLFNIPQWAIDVLDWSFVQKIVEKNLTSALSPYRDTPYAIINTSVDAVTNKNEKQSLESLDSFLTLHALSQPLQKHLLEIKKFKSPLHAVQKLKDLNTLLHNNPPIDFSDLQEQQWEECLNRLQCKVEDFSTVAEAQNFATTFIQQVKVNPAQIQQYFSDANTIFYNIQALLKKTPQEEIDPLVHFVIEIAEACQQLEPGQSIDHFNTIVTHYLQTKSFSYYQTNFLLENFQLSLTAQKKIRIKESEERFSEKVKEFFKVHNDVQKPVTGNGFIKVSEQTTPITTACANIFYDKIYKSASSIPILGKHLVTKILGVDTSVLSKGIERIGNFFKLKAKNELIIKDATRTLLDAFATKEGIHKSNFQIVKSPTLIPPLPKQKRNRLLLVVRIIGNIFFGLSEIIIAIAKAIRKTDYTPTSRQRFLLSHVEKIDLNREESIVAPENQEVEQQNIENNEPQAQPVAAVVAPQKEYNFAMQALNTSLKGPIIQAVDYISQKYLSLNNCFGMNLLQFADKAKSFTEMIADIFAHGLSNTLGSIKNGDDLVNEAKAIIDKYSPSKEFTDGLIKELSVVYKDITRETFNNKKEAKKVLDRIIDIVKEYVKNFSTKHHENITNTIKQFLDDNIILIFESIFEKFNDKIEQIGDSDWRIMFDEIVTTFDNQVQAATETTKNKQISLIQVLNDKTLIHSQLKSKLELEIQNRNRNLSDEERFKILQEWEQEKFNHIIRILIDSLMNEQAFIGVWEKMKKPTELINYINLIKAPFKSSAFKEKFDSEDIRDFFIGMAKDGLVAILGRVVRDVVKDMSEAFYWKKMAGENLLPKVVEVLNELKIGQAIKSNELLVKAFISSPENQNLSLEQLLEALADSTYAKVQDIGKISEEQLNKIKIEISSDIKQKLLEQSISKEEYKTKFLKKILSKLLTDAIDFKTLDKKTLSAFFNDPNTLDENLRNFLFAKLKTVLSIPQDSKPHPLFAELIKHQIEELKNIVQLELYEAKKQNREPSIEKALNTFSQEQIDKTDIYKSTTKDLLVLGGMNPGKLFSAGLNYFDKITPVFWDMRKSHHWLIKMIADQFMHYFDENKVQEMVDGFFTKNKKETADEIKAKKIAQEPEIKKGIQEKNIALTANVEGLLSNVSVLNKWGMRTVVSWASGVDISPKGFYNAFENIENELFKDSLLENMFLHVLHRVLDELSKPRLENVNN